MSVTFRKVILGASAISASAAGVGCWVNCHTRELPAEQKGSLLTRTKEVALAFKKSKEIEDGLTAEGHVKLVAALPSKEFLAKNESFNQKKEALIASYTAKYPPKYQETLRVSLRKSPFYFRFTERKGPVINIAGSMPQLHDLEERTDILNGNYQRCKFGKVEKLIVGMTGQNACKLVNKPS